MSALQFSKTEDLIAAASALVSHPGGVICHWLSEYWPKPKLGIFQLAFLTVSRARTFHTSRRQSDELRQ